VKTLSHFRFGLALALLCVLLFNSYAADEKRISIYSNVANYTLPIIEREGHEYVGFLEVLDPLGNVSAQTQNSRWTIRYNNSSAEFNDGKTQVQVKGRRFEMTNRFILENGRGLVPVSALGAVMPRILGGPVSVRENARRVFIGGVSVHFTAQMAKPDPPTLVMNFTNSVSPMISTEPGKLVMTFTRDPLVPPPTQQMNFDSKGMPSVTIDENNGSALVTVHGTGSLFASFSNGGRTITVTGPGQPVAALTSTTSTTVPQAAPAPPAVQSPLAQAAAPVATPTGPVSPTRYFAVIDPSHGGDERGAALTDKLGEKEVTLAFARRLKQDLQSQGMPTLLLRDGDVPLTLDQRAQIANHAHPAIFISIHASSQGTGVRLYTSLIPGDGENSGMFADWNTAQTFFLPLSRAFATALGSEIEKKRIDARVLVAPLRPLNNITRPAISIELAPPSTGLADLNSPAYHGLVSSSVSAAILSMRSQLETGR
jgi:N-acetylmuramoyl-L-alanine amidase